MKKHCATHISQDESSRITVRRTHIWQDSMRTIRRIKLQKRLRVTFLGEAGVDDGGPGREYLRLLMAAMSNQAHLLSGPPMCKVPQHNSLALLKGDFYNIGILIVLTQGGPGPILFACSEEQML